MFRPGLVGTRMRARLRGAGDTFAERDRLVGAHARGELATPTEVARRIMAEHLGPDGVVGLGRPVTGSYRRVGAALD